MRINIRQDLERPTKSGRSSVYSHIICKKDEADEKVVRFIDEQINNPNLIRTKTFAVFFRDCKGRLVHRFEYRPTYPE